MKKKRKRPMKKKRESHIDEEEEESQYDCAWWNRDSSKLKARGEAGNCWMDESSPSLKES